MLNKLLTPLAFEIISDKNIKLMNDPINLIELIKIIDCYNEKEDNNYNNEKEENSNDFYKLFEKMAKFDDFYQDIDKDRASKFDGIDDCIYIYDKYLDDYKCDKIKNHLMKIKMEIHSDEAYSNILRILNLYGDDELSKEDQNKINQIVNHNNFINKERILNKVKAASKVGSKLFRKKDNRYCNYCRALGFEPTNN